MCLKFVLNLLIILTIIIIKSESKGPRFEKYSKKYNGKSNLDGIYDKKFDEEIELSSLDNDNDNDKNKETKEKIKGKINFYEVDSDGNEYVTEIDEDEIDNIIKRGKENIKEFSTSGSGSGDNNNTNSSLARRLWILGTDTRTQVTSATYNPTNKVGLLTFTGGFCSAALVSPRTILTAGHCVHSGSGGNWYNNFVFYPKRTSTYTPTGLAWSRAYTFQGWTINSDWNWDIALIELVTTNTNLGWLSYGYNSAINSATFINSYGYPSDKSYGSMWYAAGYVKNAYTDYLTFETLDVYPGQSGSGGYAVVNSNIIIYSVCSSQWVSNGYYWNQFTRMTSTKFTSFCTWMNQPSVC